MLITPKHLTIAIGSLLLNLNASVFAAPKPTSTLNLTGIAAWQCKAQREQGQTYANETVAFVGPDCPRFYAEQNSIFGPLDSSASFEAGNFTELCFLEGYRSELQAIAKRMQESCKDQMTANMRAGMSLGAAACRIAPEGSLTPDFELGLIKATTVDPNGETFTLKLFLPLRSERWGKQLSRSQETGFHAGCILGERDFVNSVPNPYVDAAGKTEWRRVGEQIGRAFADAYCPIETARINEIVTTLTGNLGLDSGATPEATSARASFVAGFSTKCNKPITTTGGH